MGTKWNVSVDNSAFYTLKSVPTFMTFYKRHESLNYFEKKVQNLFTVYLSTFVNEILV